MNEPPIKPKPKRRWILWALLTPLVVVLAAVAYIEAPLWTELSFAADETFSNNEGWPTRQIRVDIQRNLEQHSPQHLTRYLISPSERWQAVVCLVLSGHPERDPSKWLGVPSSITTAAVKVQNPGLRALYEKAFRSMLFLDPTDVASVLETLGANEFADTKGFLERLAGPGGAPTETMTAVLKQWLSGRSNHLRNAAFPLAVRRYPELDDDCVAQYRKVFATESEDEKPWSLLHVLINRKPEIGAELLKGGQEDHEILWKALARNLTGGDPDSQAGFLASAEKTALQEYKTASGWDRDVLLAFFLSRPNGLNFVMQGIADRQDEHLQAVFDAVPPLQTVLSRRYQPLGPKEAEAFVAVFPRLSGGARQRWGDLMSVAGRPGMSNRVFPAQGGPVDPKHAASFAKLLVDDESALWVESYFENVAPLPESEVGRIVSMLRRGLKAHSGPLPPPRPPGTLSLVSFGPMGAGGGGGGGGRRQPGMTAAAKEAANFRYASLLLKKFPTHKDVAAFFKDFPKVEKAVAANGSAGSRNQG